MRFGGIVIELRQCDFETLASALPAKIHFAYAYAAASHAATWLA